MADSTTPALVSFVIPLKDENETIALLCEGIREAMSSEPYRYEIVLVDDGSTDGSWDTIRRVASESDGHVTGVRLRRNFGKATALAAGFQASSGSFVLTMDADLQDEPSEIGKFLRKLEAGDDVVSGWKVKRQDSLSKTLPSKVFNYFVSRVTGIPLRDFNCGFKAYRREVLDNIKLYGEFHRFVPVLAHDLGYRIGEVDVKHNPRRHGSSKYGFERYARGMIDLLSVLATTRYMQKPGHLFGGLGLISGGLGGGILTYLAVLWLLGEGPIGTRPLFSVGVLLVILSIQLLSLGMLAELFNKQAFVPSQIETLVAEEVRPHPEAAADA